MLAILAAVALGAATECLPLRAHSDAYERTRADALLTEEPSSAHLLERVELQDCPAVFERGNLKVSLLPVELRAFSNGAYPVDRNNGALWSGRGVSMDLAGGFGARWRWFSAALAPEVGWQENAMPVVRRVETEGRAELSSHLYDGIDVPQNMASRPTALFHPGQSYARVDAFGVGVGFSTQNLWWGGGLRNALLLSNTAPGFPHVFIRTTQPVDVWVLGRLEAELLWGHLRESPQFDADPGNDRVLFSGWMLAFSPRWPEGLSFGYGRVFLQTLPEQGLPLSRYLRPLVEPFLKNALATPANPEGNDAANQLAALYFRWAIPGSGVEFYGEFARDDHSWDALDFLMEPEHASAFQLGAQYTRQAFGGRVRFVAEGLSLQLRPDQREFRGTAVFYTHGGVKQGYTHAGQPLGAWVGPGSDSQYGAVEYQRPAWRAGAFVERTRRHLSVYYLAGGRQWGHDLELSVGGRFGRRIGAFELSAELAWSRRWNREFIEDRVSQLAAGVFATWTPARGDGAH